MNTCTECEGLIPASSSSCPHCGKHSNWWKMPAALASAGMAMVTMSCAYGAPCVSRVMVTRNDGSQSTVCRFEVLDASVVDCRDTFIDGGRVANDQNWSDVCTGYGSIDGGTSDAGIP